MSSSMIISGPVSVAGKVTVPGDKSVSHRALVFSAIAAGRSRISNILKSDDCLSTARCLRQLGVAIDISGSVAIVEGRGTSGLVEPGDILDVGNSGTALRVLPSILAAQPFFSVITGDESIRGRPVGRVLEPLSRMGGLLWARESGRFAPVAIKGARLRGIEYRLPVASAQVKTAVLLAGLLAEGETTVIEPLASRDHTEVMLDYLDAPITVDNTRRADGRRIIVSGGSEFKAKDIDVPGDFSSAAFFLAAGALAGSGPVQISETGLNPTRTGFLDVLKSMGAGFDIADERICSGEKSGSIEAEKADMRAVEIGGGLIPRVIDELPLVALIATQAEGRTVIKDAAELRVKETDRISLVVSELGKMGADIRATDDGFIVQGPTKLSGAQVDSHGDHRLAMMLAIAALVAGGKTQIDGAEAISVSFPTFFEKLEGLGVSALPLGG